MPTTLTAAQATALAPSIWFIDNSVAGGPGDRPAASASTTPTPSRSMTSGSFRRPGRATH